ncbi:hypothetical protein SVAN01_00556 [Stagonosporopsis vannaccii]|nr:hypothetical protein SVAN01_00556 [Stagonosporopsis vannaccii]
MVQRRPSVGGSDSRRRRRNASQQGAQGGRTQQGPASRRQSVSLREAASMSRRRVAGDVKDRQAGAGQCSHPFQVSAGISSAQAEQSHHPCLNELASPAHQPAVWCISRMQQRQPSNGCGVLIVLCPSALAASLPERASPHCAPVKHTAGGQCLGRFACFVPQKENPETAFRWRTQSPAPESVPRPASRSISKHVPSPAPVILLPACIRPPSLERETAAEILAGHWCTAESVRV